jgi:hypothetical protein
MNDLSFIRLEPNFNDAKYLRASTATTIFYNGQIILCPNQVYLQTTNTKLGIAFDGNFKVTIIDCNENELQNITSKVAINERTINGLPQIDFEIANIGADYYSKNVYLKFEHTVSNYVWYSNPLQITNYFDATSSRFDYKNANDTYYQSITLKCFFSVNDAESTSSEYVTYQGKKVTSRLITTELEQYFFDSIDNFTYRRLNNLLSRNIVYINGNRITNKQTLPSKARAGDTNIFNLDFKVAIDYNDIFVEELQIFDAFELVTIIPSGDYTLANVGSIIQGIFNRVVTVGIGELTVFKDTVLFATFDQTEITITNNEIEMPISLISNGVYYINITPELFISSFGEVYQGITNTTDWTFTISDGEFDNTEFNNEFFIN